MHEYDIDDGPWEEPENEFATAMNELIQAEIEKRITETVEELERFRRVNTALGKTNRELHAKIRNFDSDMKKALLEKEQEAKRTIFDGFMVGDKVYYATGKQLAEEPCETCDSKREVTVKVINQDHNIKCPTCRSERYYNRKYAYEYTPEADTIDYIKIYIESNNKKTISIYLKRLDNSKESEKVFRTLEECQKYCDDLNAKEAAKNGN